MNPETIIKDTVNNASNTYSSVSKSIRHQATKIPTSTYLLLAGGAVALSLGLALTQRRKGWANFVGEWVPSILMLGIYNKMFKTPEAAGMKEPSYH
jgi:hypothetical protein